MAIEQRIGRIDRIGQQREVFVFNLVTRGTLEEQVLHLLDEKISMFELVVGEVGAILGGLEEERDFADLMLDAWLETTEASRDRGVRRARPAPATRRGSSTRAPRRSTTRCSAKTSRPREAEPMSELRDFVADLLERQGAAVEAVEPDGLDVLAPAPVRKAMGWPELARLGFGAERAAGAIADRARGRLARPVRRAARRRRPLEPSGRCVPADAVRGAERPRTRARARARSAERGLALPGHDRDLDTLPAAGLPLHRRVGREARGAGLARLQPRHRRGHQTTCSRGCGRRWRKMPDWQAPDPATRRAAGPGWNAATLASAGASAARSAGAREHRAVPARHAPAARARPQPGPRLSRRSAQRVAEAARGAGRVRKASGRRPTGSARRCGSRPSSANTAPSSTTCATTTRCA